MGGPMPVDGRVARQPRLSWRRGLGLAVLLFITVAAVGTLGYTIIEGWAVWDAFYMTMISVTTVGFREVHEMSRAGQAWTILVTLAGVSTLFYSASLVMAEVVEGEFYQRFENRRFTR